MKGKKLIKLLISIGMLGLVLRVVNFSSLADTVRSIPLSCVVLVIAVYCVGQVLSVLKWWLIVRSVGVEITFSRTLRAYWIGMFVNCFGPGTVGGDVARGLLVANHAHSKTLVLSTVVADRAHGLCVLATIGIVSVALFHGEHLEPFLVWLLYGLVAAGLAGWFIVPRVLPRLFKKHGRITDIILDGVKAFPQQPKVIAQISAVSFAFHLLQISIHALMAYFLGLALSWSVLLTTIPFINILSTLPISWQGLGVRENGYVFFLSHFITKEQALAFGAIWLLAATLTSAVGGIIAAVTGELKLLSRKNSDQVQLVQQGVS